MLDLHLVLLEALEHLLLDIGSIDVHWFLDGHLYRHLHGYLPVDMHRHLPVDIYWFVDIHYFLSYCWHLNCLDDLFLYFKRYFLLDLDVFRYLNNFLDNSLWAGDGFGHLN